MRDASLAVAKVESQETRGEADSSGDHLLIGTLIAKSEARN